MLKPYFFIIAKIGRDFGTPCTQKGVTTRTAPLHVRPPTITAPKLYITAPSEGAENDFHEGP